MIYMLCDLCVLGTYNNQYMVVDRSKVKLGRCIDDGALTVVEQIPGLVEFSDQTQTLRRGRVRHRVIRTPEYILI